MPADLWSESVSSESLGSDEMRTADVMRSQAYQRQFIFDKMHAEYHAAASGKALPRLSLGQSGLNTALGGGLLCRRVHLVNAPAHSCAQAAFSLALVARMLRTTKITGPIIWCGPRRGGQAGHLFGAGLSEMGLRAEQFIFVRESHPLRRMAACEEALSTKGLAAVIHEYGPLYEKTDIWQKSARRLQLACERGTATAFLIGANAPASGFESAWDIAPIAQEICAPQQTNDWRPMWHACVRHVRGGYPAAADIIWDNESASFVSPASTNHQLAADSKSSLYAQRPYHHDNTDSLINRTSWQKLAS